MPRSMISVPSRDLTTERLCVSKQNSGSGIVAQCPYDNEEFHVIEVGIAQQVDLLVGKFVEK